MMARVHAWLDVSAGVAGDMLMGALVDAGADLAAVQVAVRAVAGEGVVLRSERVLRAGLPATKVHVEIVADGATPRTIPQLRARMERATIDERTRSMALRTLERLGEAYGRGYGLPADEVAMPDLAALDVLTDIVGDCEALRLLGVESVTASPLALGSGRIRTSHGDLEVPTPPVVELARGWRTTNPEQSGDVAEQPADDPHPLRHLADRYVPVGGVSDAAGALTEEPARVVGGGLGELATPTGAALLRSFAQDCLHEPPMPVTRTGVGAGGRDTPGRPNVVRVLLG